VTAHRGRVRGGGSGVGEYCGGGVECGGGGRVLPQLDGVALACLHSAGYRDAGWGCVRVRLRLRLGGGQVRVTLGGGRVRWGCAECPAGPREGGALAGTADEEPADEEEGGDDGNCDAYDHAHGGFVLSVTRCN
jgi:hypothetical protein